MRRQNLDDAFVLETIREGYADIDAGQPLSERFFNQSSNVFSPSLIHLPSGHQQSRTAEVIEWAWIIDMHHVVMALWTPRVVREFK